MTIRAQYDADLAALKTAVAEMGGCAADADAAAAVVKGDGRINSMQRDIEHRCMTLLLRQQPVAGDLRRISTTMKVVTDVERIGDHASDIAEIIPHLVTVRKEGDPAERHRGAGGDDPAQHRVGVGHSAQRCAAGV